MESTCHASDIYHLECDKCENNRGICGSLLSSVRKLCLLHCTRDRECIAILVPRDMIVVVTVSVRRTVSPRAKTDPWFPGGRSVPSVPLSVDAEFERQFPLDLSNLWTIHRVYF